MTPSFGMEISLQYWTGEADEQGLVSDELMLEVVKAELDRLRGKVSYHFEVSVFAKRERLTWVELDHRRFPQNATSG